MILSRIRKIMYTPVNPSFTIQKWGLRGSKLYRCVFVVHILEGGRETERDRQTERDSDREKQFVFNFQLIYFLAAGDNYQTNLEPYQEIRFFKRYFKESTLKGNNLLPNSFLLQWTPFWKGLGIEASKQEVTKVVSL